MERERLRESARLLSERGDPCVVNAFEMYLSDRKVFQLLQLLSVHES